jgi:CBS domain-containing protein
MKVRDVMKKAVAIEKDISLREAAKIMTQNKIGSLVIVSKDNIRGIVTEKDITEHAGDLSRKVSGVMARNTITIEEDDEISNAAELMAKNKISHLPVLNGDKLSGIITSSDLLQTPEDIDDDFAIE